MVITFLPARYPTQFVRRGHIGTELEKQWRKVGGKVYECRFLTVSGSLFYSISNLNVRQGRNHPKEDGNVYRMSISYSFSARFWNGASISYYSAGGHLYGPGGSSHKMGSKYGNVEQKVGIFDR